MSFDRINDLVVRTKDTRKIFSLRSGRRCNNFLVAVGFFRHKLYQSFFSFKNSSELSVARISIKCFTLRSTETLEVCSSYLETTKSEARRKEIICHYSVPSCFRGWVRGLCIVSLTKTGNALTSLKSTLAPWKGWAKKKSVTPLNIWFLARLKSMNGVLDSRLVSHLRFEWKFHPITLACDKLRHKSI